MLIGRGVSPAGCWGGMVGLAVTAEMAALPLGVVLLVQGDGFAAVCLSSCRAGKSGCRFSLAAQSLGRFKIDKGSFFTNQE